MQDTNANMHKAKVESEGRLAAMRKELLAAEDRERAELEHEYRQASQPWDTMRAIDSSAWTFSLLTETPQDIRQKQATSAYRKQCCIGLCSMFTADLG